MTASSFTNEKYIGTNKTGSIFAGFAMALGLSFHFFGYECARAASISLLGAKEIGLGSEALSYVQMVGSPASALTLYTYAKSIKTFGPRFTFRVSSMICLCLLGIMCIIRDDLKGIMGQIAVVVFYAFREIYVSLISTQQWAFIASILDSSTSSYMVKFSGIVSVSSAVGGCMIELLVSIWGLQGLLYTAFLSSLLCYGFSEVAYTLISDKDGGNSSNIASGSSGSGTNTNHNSSSSSSSNHTDNNNNGVKNKLNLSVWRESWELMRKNTTLQILFVEAIFHQLVGNMLNLMFHDALRNTIHDDGSRATIVGRFFATVNVSSCFLQFFVLPGILSQKTLPQMLANIPMLIFMTTMVAYLFPSLIGVMIAFGAMKVIEYSVMTAATEMIYMPMGKDVRYLGKELVKFFGHKLGKSGSSIFLSTVSAMYKPTLPLQAGLTFFTTSFWAVSMYALANHLRARDVALGIVKIESNDYDDMNTHDDGRKKKKYTKKKRWDGYFDNLYPSESSSDSELSSSDTGSSTSLCDIYGSEINSPPTGPYYYNGSFLDGGEVVDNDVGLNIDDPGSPRLSSSSILANQSGDTMCCGDGGHRHLIQENNDMSTMSAQLQDPVVGVVSYVPPPIHDDKSHYYENDHHDPNSRIHTNTGTFDQIDNCNDKTLPNFGVDGVTVVDNLHGGDGDGSGVRARHHHKKQNVYDDDIDSSYSKKTLSRPRKQSRNLSNFLSIFSPQKAKKQDTILRVGSEAVMFTTLIDKHKRRLSAAINNGSHGNNVTDNDSNDKKDK